MLLILFAALLGAGIGSFLNVVASRLHERKSLGGRSVCLSCGRTLGPLDLVPVFSFVFLRGRCRTCRARIPAYHPVVEALTAALFALAAWVRLGDPSLVGAHLDLALLRDGLAISFLVLLSLADALYGELSDRLTVPAVIVLFAASVAAGISPWNALLGAAVGAAFFLLQRIVSRGTWVGDADAFVGAAIGGLLGWAYGLAAIFLAYILGALVTLPLLLAGRVTRKTAIPFIPFLSAGALIVLFFGPALWSVYLGLALQ